jgi:hypothetical protein
MSSRSTAKKSLQSFHARTTLWKLFEIRAQEMDCSVDYLINEAMRLYATTHDFLQDYDSRPPPAFDPKQTANIPAGATRPNAGPPRAAPPEVRSSVPPPSLPRPSALGNAPPMRPPQPQGQTQGQTPGPAPAGPSTFTGTAEHRPSLTLIFQGRKIPVPGNQFIIGRGAKSSDLTIRDANISRKHAAIIFHNGAYYLKDLGSTNGNEYKGQRLDSKRIDEGDVFSICDYEFHFTYMV